MILKILNFFSFPFYAYIDINRFISIHIFIKTILVVKMSFRVCKSLLANNLLIYYFQSCPVALHKRQVFPTQNYNYYQKSYCLQWHFRKPECGPSFLNAPGFCHTSNVASDPGEFQSSTSSDSQICRRQKV